MSEPNDKPKTGTTLQPQAADYGNVLAGVVELLDTARRTSARVVNTLMTATYWEIGRRMVEHEQAGQKRAGYGEEVVGKFSKDLTQRFGRGFGPAQVAAMRQFHLTFPLPDNFQSVIGKSEILQSVIGKSSAGAVERLSPVARALPLPWTHYVRLLRVRNSLAREFYAREALAGGWSVRQLDRQINSQFYERTALSKDKAAMLLKGESPKPEDAVSADEEIRNPLLLEFLNLKDEYSESELEDALIRHLETFLLELGNEFAFVGRQKRLRIGHEWFRVDLVFFHRRLRCLLIIDLKIGELVHADIGQMNLYTNFAREHWMQPGENPPVGLILCTGKNDALAHYAMEGLGCKMLVREYEAALTFMLSESTRLTGQLRREKMQAREFSVAVRFTNFTEVGTSHRFKHPQFLNSVINEVMEQMFRGIMAGQRLPVRQIRIAMYNLERLDTHPTLWGRTHEERWGAVDDVAQKLNEQLGKTALMTGAQFALRHIDESQKQPKAKCPFTPQREMITKLWGANGPAKMEQQTLF